MNQPGSLFTRPKTKKKLHPSFEFLLNSKRHRSARLILDQAYARFNDKDFNFVEQFQTTGFDNRTFELYISELLQSEGFTIVGSQPQPDFVAEKSGTVLCIECTTANRTDTGGHRLIAYEPVNQLDLSADSIKDRSENDLPIRIAGALRNKMRHRVGKRDPKAYWELPETKERPFIIAVQTFHEHGSLAFSSSGVANYLYGTKHSPTWDQEGNLVVRAVPIDNHTFGAKTIPSNFFAQPETENVSAVLWTNAGTVPKFTRMALAGSFPDENCSMVRFGTMYDPDPNAHKPAPFAYIVGEEGSPEETWGQEAVLFHNPRATYPLPAGLFAGLTENHLDEGVYVSTMKGGFSPFMSVSNVISGPGHRRMAAAYADNAFNSLMTIFRPTPTPESDS